MVQADYSEQLKAIVQALNRPATPGWLIAIIGAITGVVLSVLSQLLLRWFDRFTKRRDMQRMLYIDLVEMFWAVDWIGTRPEGTDETPETFRAWQKIQINSLLKFTAEEHAKRNPDIYMQLKERGAAEMIYRHLHQLVDEPNWLSTNLSFILTIFSSHLQEGFLSAKVLQRALGKERATKLMLKTAEIYKTDQEAIKAIMARPGNNEGDAH
jgi:hypothetical protein